jgi:aldose 1-epimerase
MGECVPSAIDRVVREGYEVISLYDRETDSKVELVPRLGGNIVSFAKLINGQWIEIIATPPTLETLVDLPTRWGNGVLFPYPGRVSNDQFVYRGRQITLPRDPTTANAMHGLIRRREWKVVESGVSQYGEVWILLHIGTDISSISQVEWPFKFNIYCRVSLKEGKLRTEVKIENVDSETMPFGIGFHPYFNVPFGPSGSFGDCLIGIEADYLWEGFLDPHPTVSSVGSDMWPRRFLSLDEIPHTVQLPDGPSRNYTFQRGHNREDVVMGSVIDPVNQVRADITVSPDFTSMVMFTPAEAPTVSLEPHTCIPNALNLVNYSTDHDPGLIDLSAGETWSSWYEIDASSL